MQMKEINQKVVEEFRANGGKVSMFDYPLIILHTIGRNSGDTHLVPLGLSPSDDDEIYLYGTFVGSKTDPVWAHNLRATANIDVELADETYVARVEEIHGEAAENRLAAMAEFSGQFADYITSAAPRIIPVFKVSRL
jgi:deazaflavin-dependent oxidoreductase (nitroreductase family)